MDEVIYRGVQGHRQLEIVLDRKVADKRVFPAIDILKSGTRKEELITPEGSSCRRPMCCAASSTRMGPQDAIEFLLDKLRQTKENSEFFDKINTYGSRTWTPLSRWLQEQGRSGVAVVRVSGPPFDSFSKR